MFSLFDPRRSWSDTGWMTDDHDVFTSYLGLLRLDPQIGFRFVLALDLPRFKLAHMVLVVSTFNHVAMIVPYNDLEAAKASARHF